MLLNAATESGGQYFVWDHHITSDEKLSSLFYMRYILQGLTWWTATVKQILLRHHFNQDLHGAQIWPKVMNVETLWCSLQNSIMMQDPFPASITQLPVADSSNAARHSNLSHAGLKVARVWREDMRVWLIPEPIPHSPPLKSRQMVESRLAERRSR